MNDRTNERRNEQRNEQTKEGRNEQTDKGTNKQEQKKNRKITNKEKKSTIQQTSKPTQQPLTPRSRLLRDPKGMNVQKFRSFSTPPPPFVSPLCRFSLDPPGESVLICLFHAQHKCRVFSLEALRLEEDDDNEDRV